MQLDKQTLRPIFAVFAVFFAVSFAIYFYGKQKHDEGEGLSESVAREYIVQYFVQVSEGAKVDAKTAPATRAQIGREEVLKLRLRNLGSQTKKFSLAIEVHPENGTNVEIRQDPSAVYELNADAEYFVEIPFILKASELNTRDGTIDFRIRVSALD